MYYQEALQILHHHYGHKESINVKAKNDLSVQQNAGEDDRNYLKRVEQLSRKLEFSTKLKVLFIRYCKQ